MFDHNWSWPTVLLQIVHQAAIASLRVIQDLLFVDRQIKLRIARNQVEQLLIKLESWLIKVSLEELIALTILRDL